MLSVEQALAQCLADVPPVVQETVPIDAAYGRVLAEDVTAPHALPPWDNSAMDGYAVLASDTGWTSAHTDPSTDPCAEIDEGTASQPTVTLVVLETIAAGQVGTQTVAHGTCARIMTGAPVPEGADTVVMRERTTVLEKESADQERVVIEGVAHRGQHIRKAGEEVAAGSVVLPRGTTLSPAGVGLCASVGRAEVVVARRPTVGIVSTGDEIVPPGQPLAPGQIHSSNTHALTGMVLAAGAVPVDCGIAPDTVEGTRDAFRRAMECDVIVSTGGVSVGDFDVVRQALTEEGAEMRFWKIRMKPGKPLAFGVLGGRPAFGLPGNPVSCQVNFLQFVRPYLRLSMGDPLPYLPVVDATLGDRVKKRRGRAELVRVTLSWRGGHLIANSTGAQGSGMQTSMVHAHGLMLLGPDVEQMDVGETVAVQVIDPGFLRADRPGYRW